MPLLTQQTQRIEVIVRKEEAAQVVGAKEKSAEEQSGENALQEARTPKYISNFRRRAVNAVTRHAVNVVKNGVFQTVNFIISGTGIRNGDQSMQQQTERSIEIVSDTISMGYSIASGAVYGSMVGMGNPGVIVAGTMMGLATAVVSNVTKYQGRKREYNYKLFKEENGIAYLRARASINLTNGRLR